MQLRMKTFLLLIIVLSITILSGCTTHQNSNEAPLTETTKTSYDDLVTLFVNGSYDVYTERMEEILLSDKYCIAISQRRYIPIWGMMSSAIEDKDILFYKIADESKKCFAKSKKSKEKDLVYFFDTFKDTAKLDWNTTVHATTCFIVRNEPICLNEINKSTNQTVRKSLRIILYEKNGDLPDVLP